MPKSAAIYARISDDRLGDMLGVTRQVEDCQQLAERKGWTVAEVYIDDDRSAYSGKPRPRYRTLLGDLKEGTRDALLVYDLYRLIRLPRELEEFFDVCDASGVRHLASVTGDIDLGTENGRFHARILGAVAHKESADKARRIARKHLELAQRGKISGGGLRPYGYAADKRTVIPQEAAVVREVAARFLAGDALSCLADELNARKIPSATGGVWTIPSLRRTLISARIGGQREHRGEIVATADWPALIPVEQSVRLRAILLDPARRRSRPPRTYLLSGMVRCELCGSTMLSRAHSPENRRYACARLPGRPGCGRITVNAPALETLITEAVLYRLDTPALATALTKGLPSDEDAADLGNELTEAEAQADELAAAYGSNQISLREWLVAREPLERRLDMLRKRLHQANGAAALDGYIGRADVLRDEWPTLSVPRCQAIVKTLLDHVVVTPGIRGLNRFDRNRIKPLWRM